ncbi:MAG: replication-associated recombination protein A [Kofleriaceae bacterium]
MDLFGHAAGKRGVGQPLAERMRPQALADVIGQGHLLGAGRLLGGLVPDAPLPSLILWGPPGTGKTTLARLIGEAVRANVIRLSAVDSGVKDVREAAAEAAARRDQYGTRTLLFIDEIHRFSRSQQDSLLPHVEAGTVTLVGATTENPSFGVVAALLSRCRVLRLERLTDDDLGVLLDRALTDGERGLGALGVTLGDDARAALIANAAGDARRALNTLEVAAHLARRTGEPGVVSADHVAEAAQAKTLLYDKAGDEHYGVVSAFIKSLRGSDPDAAVYWMTRMLEAGEDPRFVLRRIVIFASEDVGVADPQALAVATSALTAFELVGLPEGVLPMTQAVLYLALAPKSNTALTSYAAARALVRDRGPLPVPAKLRNAVTALGKAAGHGEGYKYPHDFEGNYVPEDYLPEALVGERIYTPSQSGLEAGMAARLAALRAKRSGRRDRRGRSTSVTDAASNCGTNRAMASPESNEEIFLGIAHALFLSRLHVLRLTEVVRHNIRPNTEDQNMEGPGEHRPLSWCSSRSTTSSSASRRRCTRRSRPAKKTWLRLS